MITMKQAVQGLDEEKEQIQKYCTVSTTYLAKSNSRFGAKCWKSDALETLSFEFWKFGT